ncbi:molybdopterin-binding protein [Desulfocurvus sp. DL9XJH121]
MKRTMHLQTIPLDLALSRTRDALDRDALVGSERVPAHQAGGRVTSRAVRIEHWAPPENCSGMDGVAVRAQATAPASPDNPLRLSPGADFAPVNTGNPLPEGLDAVIMVEDLIREDDGCVTIQAPAAPWQHVRRKGSDYAAGRVLLPAGHLISPADVGALLSAGVWELDCVRRVRLRMIPTGDEVLDFTKRPLPGPGQVVESNTQMLTALAPAWGCEALRVPPVPDDPEALRAAVAEALASEAHVVVMGAGTSRGTRDYSRAILESVGAILAHGIQMRPGSPTILAVARPEFGGKLLVAAPGPPAGALLCFEEILEPLALWLGRRPRRERPRVRAAMACAALSRPGEQGVLRLGLGLVRGQAVAVPLPWRLGRAVTMTWGQAVARVPADSPGFDVGDEVDVELLPHACEPERTLILAGPQSPALVMLADALLGLEEPVRPALALMDARAALAALDRGLCHLAVAPGPGPAQLPGADAHLVAPEDLRDDPGVRAALALLEDPGFQARARAAKG